MRKESLANQMYGKYGDSKQISVAACDMTLGQWWERRLAK